MYNIKYRRVNLNAHFQVFRSWKLALLTHKAISKRHGRGPPKPPASTSSAEGINKDLTCDERKQMVSRMLTLARHGDHGVKFPRGTITAVAAEFHVCTQTLRRVWARARENNLDPTVRQYQASPKKKGRCGRKKSGILKPFERQSGRSHCTKGGQSETLLQR